MEDEIKGIWYEYDAEKNLKSYWVGNEIIRYKYDVDFFYTGIRLFLFSPESGVKIFDQ